MNHKVTLMADIQTKIFSKTAVVLNNKNHSVKAALRRHSFF